MCGQAVETGLEFGFGLDPGLPVVVLPEVPTDVQFAHMMLRSAFTGGVDISRLRERLHGQRVKR